MNPKFEAEKQKILEALAVYREKFGKEPSSTTMMDGKVLERLKTAVKTGIEIPDEEYF